MSHIKYKLKQWEEDNTVVVFQILEQSDLFNSSLRYGTKHNNINLEISQVPEINSSTKVYFRGMNKAQDLLVSAYKFSNVTEAEKFIANFNIAVSQFVNSFAPIPSTEPKYTEKLGRYVFTNGDQKLDVAFWYSHSTKTLNYIIFEQTKQWYSVEYDYKDIRILSMRTPEIRSTSLYLRGTEKEANNTVSQLNLSHEKADTLINNIIAALKYVNTNIIEPTPTVAHSKGIYEF